MVREALGSQLQTTSPVTTIASVTPPAGASSFSSAAFCSIMQQSPVVTGLPSLTPQISAEGSEVQNGCIKETTALFT